MGVWLLIKLVRRAYRGGGLPVCFPTQSNSIRGKLRKSNAIAIEEARGMAGRASGREWQLQTGSVKGRLFCPPDVFAPLADRDLRELKDPGFEW